MDPASYSSQLEHQGRCSQEEKKSLVLYGKKGNVLLVLTLLLPSPLSHLSPSGFGAGQWEAPRGLPMHPGPCVTTDVPLRNTGQQSGALFLRKL